MNPAAILPTVVDSAARHIVVGLGELLWDSFAQQRRPGGAPANVAYHASQLAADGIICSRIGCDDAGTALCALLAQRGLSVAQVQRDHVHPTGLVTVDTSNPNRPSYHIHEGVAWDHLEYTSELAKLMRAAHAICFGTLAQRSTVSANTIHQALADAERALIVFDVNLRPPWYTRAVIERSLAACSVAKLNLEEFTALNDLLRLRADNLEDFCGRLRREYGVELMCITRGSDGCLLAEENEMVDIPGEPVTVTDAVGAGDAFCAALIIARLNRWPLEICAKFANAAGALVAGRAGAMPDVRRTYAELRAALTSQLPQPSE